MNLGGHQVISMNALIRLMEEMIGRPANVQRGPAVAADMLANQANVEKARRMLGWEPQVPLEEGIRRLVEWYQAERSWVSEIKTN